MDGDQALGGFSSEGLAAIPPGLEAVAKAGDLSGFVTLVWRKGEVAQVNTIGHRDVEAGLPMTRDTMFRIASMTKPITSVAALMLIDDGKLRLDDPISKWLPEFADMKVLKAPDGPLDQVVPAAREITVEDLFTHRSGIAYAFTSTGPIAKAHEEALGPPFHAVHGPDAWLKRLGALPLSFQPGERFHYGHSTDVLGLLAGRVAGMSYRDLIMERILGPLGMKDTDFWCPPEKRDRMAKLYRIDPKTDQRQDVSFPHLDAPPAFCEGGGGLISTADDYLAFASMLIGGGELNGRRYLKPETVKLMRTNRLTEEQRAIPFLGMPFWLGQGFGLGVSVVMDPAKQAWMGAGSEGSFGWPGIFGTWWQGDPSEDMIMIYLIQNSSPVGPEAVAAMASGARMGGRLALPMFQKGVYAALGKTFA